MERGKVVSVIIPCGRPGSVQKTIEGLKRQTFDRDLFEILIISPVDIGMDKGDDLAIKTIKTECLFSPGKMRNIGASTAEGRYLAFIDDDCIPATNWVIDLVSQLNQHNDVGAVGCRVVSNTNEYWKRAADYSLFAAYQYFTPQKRPLGSAAIIFRRSSFNEVGGFDENLQASEDWDICLKLQESGWECLFESNVKVIHEHGCNSFTAILKKSYLYGFRSRLVVQQRHRKQMSWLAKLSVAMSSPWLYWTLIIPYSLLVSTMQGAAFVKNDCRILIYYPILLSSRVMYHCGVFSALFKNDKTAV